MVALRNVLVASAAVAVLTTGVACSKGAGTEKKSGKVVARIDSVEITTGELQEELDKLPPYLKGRVATPEGRREFLENLLTRRALMLEAEDLGLEKDPQIARQITEYKERLILQKLMQENIPKEPQITDEDLQAYYDEHADEFKVGEQVRARHILLKVDAKDAGDKRAAVRKKAEDLLKRARRGENFEKLAKEHSEDGSASRGGDLGFFPRGRMVEEFEKVAFAMTKEGEISNLVETKFGYHIIQFVGRQPAKEKSFEEAKEQIRRRLAPQRQREGYQTFVDNVKQKHKITIQEDVLASLGADKDEKAAVKPAKAQVPVDTDAE